MRTITLIAAIFSATAIADALFAKTLSLDAGGEGRIGGYGGGEFTGGKFIGGGIGGDLEVDGNGESAAAVGHLFQQVKISVAQLKAGVLRKLANNIISFNTAATGVGGGTVIENTAGRGYNYNRQGRDIVSGGHVSGGYTSGGYTSGGYTSGGEHDRSAAYGSNGVQGNAYPNSASYSGDVNRLGSSSGYINPKSVNIVKEVRIGGVVGNNEWQRSQG